MELKSGAMYRGKLIDAEDSMNIQLKDVACTARDGRVTHLEQVYVRGSQLRFLIVPDMLKNAPLFKKLQERGARTRGPGKAGSGRGGRGGARGGRKS